MNTNDYTVFPKPANNGDTYQFRGRIYIYDAVRDAWFDSSIPQPVDMTQYTFEYRDTETMSTIVVSRQSDLDADMLYNQLVKSKNSRLQQADIYINRYNERAQFNIEQTESLSDIINYKVAVEAIDNDSDPNTVVWPPEPWK